MSPFHPEHPDAGHPGSASDDDSSDTIEMTNLEEVVVTPNPRSQGYHTPFLPDEDSGSEDEDAEGGDEGERALLGSAGRSRGSERSPGRPLSIWAQVKDLVIEVRPQ